jgi:hypothetical protein
LPADHGDSRKVNQGIGTKTRKNQEEEIKSPTSERNLRDSPKSTQTTIKRHEFLALLRVLARGDVDVRRVRGLRGALDGGCIVLQSIWQG